MDDPKQCKDCVYWHDANGGKGHSFYEFCHYYLNTGNRRVHKDGVCYSRTTDKRKRKKRKFNPFMMEI